MSAELEGLKAENARLKESMAEAIGLIRAAQVLQTLRPLAPAVKNLKAALEAEYQNEKANQQNAG